MKDQSKSDTIDRIIASARAEFSDKGYDAASLSNIASNAGITKQHLHYYFANKKELYCVILNKVSEAILRLHNKGDYINLTPTEAISFLTNRIIDLHIAMPELTKVTLDQGIHHATHIGKQLEFAPSTKKFINKVIDPILKYGISSGEFRSGVDAAMLYTTIFHIASGCFLVGSSMSRTVPEIDFTSPEGIEIWRKHSVEFILMSLKA